MWIRVQPGIWCEMDRDDGAIPETLRSPGFVVVRGVGVTTESAMHRLLSTLDVCHARDEAFTLAAGGLYCHEADLRTLPPPLEDGAPPHPPVDLTLSHGFYTRWPGALRARPRLRREAVESQRDVWSTLGRLECLLRGEDATGAPLLPIERLPPALRRPPNTTLRAQRRWVREVRRGDWFKDPDVPISTTTGADDADRDDPSSAGGPGALDPAAVRADVAMVAP